MSDKKILAEATKMAGVHSQAKVVWIVHPLLEQMSLAFASYAGMESLAEHGKPLLVVAIKAALAALAGKKGNERAGVAAFAKTLLEYSCEVFAQQVFVDTKKGEIEWSPFVCGLTEFIALNPQATLTICRHDSVIPKEIARAIMMTKILPHSLLDQKFLAELFNETELTA
jgi:hypothetical protein